MAYGPDQILEGLGNSDYERYIRTEELLALQKSPDEWLHRDELLFTVVHQASELWLKLSVSEVYQVANYLAEGNFRMALRLVPRILICIKNADESLSMLDQMTPWDYQQVRRALGHGSGFDSPGFNALRKALPNLGKELHRLLAVENIELLTVFLEHEKYDDLYSLAQALLEIDQSMFMWRQRHFKVVERSIGTKVSGTQGTPVEVLGNLNTFSFYPELWDIRTTITNYAIAEEGEN
jgi:tryptophan 2,3-dioxygenase